MEKRTPRKTRNLSKSTQQKQKENRGTGVDKQRENVQTVTSQGKGEQPHQQSGKWELKWDAEPRRLDLQTGKGLRPRAAAGSGSQAPQSLTSSGWKLKGSMLEGFVFRMTVILHLASTNKNGASVSEVLFFYSSCFSGNSSCCTWSKNQMMTSQDKRVLPHDSRGQPSEDLEPRAPEASWPSR